MNTYNNERSYYEIIPLRDSNIKRSVIFCGKFSKNLQIPKEMLGRTCLYLETDKEIVDNNRFENEQRLLNLIWLATGLPVDYQAIKVDDYNNFESIYDDFKCDMFYNPNVNFCGFVADKNPIARVARYSFLTQKLGEEDFKKFDNALNTYIWAQEIQRLPNPHQKYTLYMTLFLSSINQLANRPQSICDAYLACQKCGKQTGMKHETSHIAEIEKLIKELLTGNDLQKVIKKVKSLYHSLRSSFLHDGLLCGYEKEGGFMFGASSEIRIKLVEDMVNVARLNRQLLELFLQKRQNTV